MSKNKNKKAVHFNKDQMKRLYWGIGNATFIILTFVFGSWFVLFASMYAFLMGFAWCKNNWLVGANKVLVTENKVKKENLEI